MGEGGDFSTSEKELLDTIDTLSRAIAILEREMTKNPQAFAQFDKKGAKNLEGIVQALEAVVDAAAFSTNDKQTLLTLVQSQDDSDVDDLGAPAAAVYKSKKGAITDTLEDLKDKAESQLNELR